MDVSFQKQLSQMRILLSRCSDHFFASDLGEVAEQYDDVIQWDQSNRAYILIHGVSGVDWTHYKRPLPEHVYDVYMQYWSAVSLQLSPS
ncbi:MAG: hypothetical protein ACXVIF_05500 [Halobacteriota archaeon]